MIQHAFTQAYTQQVSAQNQGINTITSGAKDLATLVAGVAGFASGSTGALASATQHALAGRVGGIGGNIMLSTLQEKTTTVQSMQKVEQMFSASQVSNVISEKLGTNPINNTARKQLSTVFETLTQSSAEKQQKTLKPIETSLGKIDPSSELGKRIMEEKDE